MPRHASQLWQPNPAKDLASKWQILCGGSMKQRFSYAIVVALLSGCTLQIPHWPHAFLGDPAPITAAAKAIVIRPDTKWVNVTGGDTVRFDVGGKSFAWTFNVARGIHSFELNRVAPPGMLEHTVVAYVAPDPRYIGGGNDDPPR